MRWGCDVLSPFKNDKDQGEHIHSGSSNKQGWEKQAPNVERAGPYSVGGEEGAVSGSEEMASGEYGVGLELGWEVNKLEVYEALIDRLGKEVMLIQNFYMHGLYKMDRRGWCF